MIELFINISKHIFNSLYNIFILPIFILFFFGQVFADGIVAGYYPSWLKSTIPAEDIKFQNLTHIIHAFAWPNADGSISAYNGFDYPQLINEAHAVGKKILVALGGWGQSEGFSPMVADSVVRAIFIENITDYCFDNGYDGVDVDWEYPVNATDKTNLNLLIRELRAAFDNISEEWLITMAVPAGSWNGQWFDFTTLKTYVNYFGCMTYDYMGSWVSIAYHNSPLYPHTSTDLGSVKAGIQYINATRGIPKNQILLGIPFYGRGCNAIGLFKSNTGGNVEYRYSEVVPKIGNGWNYYWDDISKVPYLTNKDMTKFISYDDTASVRLKCEYAKERNLGGVMIWALGQDVIGDDQPLAETVGRSMDLVSGIYLSQQGIPESFLLLNNYPNPFNASTTIRYEVNLKSFIEVKVYNLKGKEIKTLVYKIQDASEHEVKWDGIDKYGKDVSSGIYFYVLRAGKDLKFKKMVLTR